MNGGMNFQVQRGMGSLTARLTAAELSQLRTWSVGLSWAPEDILYYKRNII